MQFSAHVKIAGTGAAVPERVVTNTDLVELADVDPQWTESRLGIVERRIASAGQHTSDIAAAAGRRALAASGIDPKEIDLLIVATFTPDRQAPATACLVQDMLGLGRVPAFDLAAVCSGFLYATSVASQYIESGAAARALVIGADVCSSTVDWSRRDCVYFGDGAGAVVLTRSNLDRASLTGLLRADGRWRDAYTIPPGEVCFQMDGGAVRDVALSVLPEVIDDLLKITGTAAADVDCVIPHQPAITVLQRVAELSGIAFSSVKTNMNRFANTAGASIPLLLDQTCRAGEIRADSKILFVAIGSGMTWGAMLYDWH